MTVQLRRGASLIPGILLILISSAQVPKPGKSRPNSSKKVSPVEKTVPIQATNHTLLWQISGNGLKKPSYIFGTMHLLCADDARLSENLKKAIRETDQIYFELDLDDMSQLLSTMKYLRMNDNTKLSDLITKEEYERVKKYFNDHPTLIPFAMMERFKPFMLTSLISESGIGCEATNGMEMSIMEEARKTNKEIKGLETTQYQAGLFDSIPYEKQAKELLNYIDSIDKYNKSTEDLMEVYKKQDLDKIQELTTKSEAGIDEYLDLLIYNRNRRWMQALNLELRSKPTLIAVGAGHLPGDQGMLQLLKKAGFKLKPISNLAPVLKNSESELKSS
jgi:uncharacterized protein YbaP (TraB family)